MKFSAKKALDISVKAARAAGKLMCSQKGEPKKINEQSQHDIKLELDVRCQKLIEGILLKAFPETAFLGEEGLAGVADSPLRWVVDPIDGTVNFAYGIPHACVSIALQQRGEDGSFTTIVGVVYDPFCDELWSAIRGQPAKLNGKIIHASKRTELAESIVAIGFSKTADSLRENLPVFNLLVRRVRKIRMMGSAALALTYVASGRFDAYIESGISLWDIAAGGLILECAGGEFWHHEIPNSTKFTMIANNGLLRAKLEKLKREAHKASPKTGH